MSKQVSGIPGQTDSLIHCPSTTPDPDGLAHETIAPDHQEAGSMMMPPYFQHPMELATLPPHSAHFGSSSPSFAESHIASGHAPQQFSAHDQQEVQTAPPLPKGVHQGMPPTSSGSVMSSVPTMKANKPVQSKSSNNFVFFMPSASMPTRPSGTPGVILNGRMEDNVILPFSKELKDKKASFEKIKQIQLWIERCLYIYLSQSETQQYLHLNHGIDPTLTSIVWSKLESLNPEFFRSYNIRLKIKEQIAVFNFLVQQQQQLMQQRSAMSYGPPLTGPSPHFSPAHPFSPASHQVPSGGSQFAVSSSSASPYTSPQGYSTFPSTASTPAQYAAVPPPAFIPQGSMYYPSNTPHAADSTHQHTLSSSHSLTTEGPNSMAAPVSHIGGPHSPHAHALSTHTSPLVGARAPESPHTTVVSPHPASHPHTPLPHAPGDTQDHPDGGASGHHPPYQEDINKPDAAPSSQGDGDLKATFTADPAGESDMVPLNVAQPDINMDQEDALEEEELIESSDFATNFLAGEDIDPSHFLSNSPSHS